jgi:hypothetical protein
MAQIFGDTTDEITFGGVPPSAKPLPHSEKGKFQKTSQSDEARGVPPHSKPSQRPQNEVRPQKVRNLTMPEPESLASSLGTLIDSMKPTYLPNFSDGVIRLVALSESHHTDPLVLVRSEDVSLIFGTGFSTLENAGKTYVTFPDFRLVASEKDRLAGWILTKEGFDVSLFETLLEFLNFPFVYATREVIAYIRNNIKNASFLEKCRFFEILSPGMTERKIAHFTLIPVAQ